MRARHSSLVLSVALSLALCLTVACSSSGDSGPEYSELPIRLNEVAPSPATGADWVEVVNPTDGAVDLSGVTLARGSASFSFKAGTTLPARGYLVVRCEEDPDGPDSAPFTLPREGATLTLDDAEGARIDRTTYPEMREGASWGRVPDANGDWQVLNAPTPWAANSASADLTALRLNELFANGSLGEDWVEIANPTAVALALEDATLSVGDERWTFPAGTEVPPNGFLLVICDGSDSDGRASFTLPTEGETVTLSASNAVIDETAYPEQRADWSWGRQPDVTGDWRGLSAPTPEATNGVAPPADGIGALRLNEVAANGSFDQDWIEIFNPTDEPIDVSGATLSDGTATWAFPPDTVVPAEGYLVVICDGTGAYGRASFKLSATGETITLRAPSSNGPGELVDETTYGLVPLDTSWGRLPDGVGDWRVLGTPSPGEANRTDEAVFEDLAPLRLNEVFANGSVDEDWIEIFNPTDEDIELNGATLSDGSDTWPFPADALVPAEGYLVVICDGTGVDGKASFKLSSAGETAALATLDGDVIDETTFGALELDQSWGRLPNGDGDWQTLPSPTPGAANEGVEVPSDDLTPLRLNEVFANGVTDLDWVEIYNPTDEPLRLAGATLSNGVDTWALPGETIAPPNGFFVVLCDGTGEAGKASFRLASTGGTVSLSSSTTDGDPIAIDDTEYGPQPPDQSWGRLPDGDGAWQVLRSPTIGASNRDEAPGPDLSVLRLNELLTHPDGGGPWVELVNPSDAELDIAGATLTDGMAEWAAPEDTLIPAGGFHVVEIADTPIEMPLAGGRIALSAPGFGELDSTAYGPLPADQSWGRLPNATGTWLALRSPTPGESNRDEPPLDDLSPLRLNEVYGDPDGAQDWLEIANPTPAPLSLRGATLYVDTEAWELSPELVIPAGGFLTLAFVEPESDARADGQSAPFRLPPGGAAITMVGPLATGNFGILDSLSFVPQSAGESWGRLPDVTGRWQSLITPTPGAPNSNEEPPVDLSALRLNEVFASGSDSEDWLEIVNPNDEALDLSGARITVGTEAWLFPDGTTAPANGFLVVICDGSGADGRASFVLPSGGATMTLSERSADGTGARADRVTYGPQPQDLSWGRLPDATGEWQSLRSPTPGEANRDDEPPVDLSPLRLNELRPATADADGWVEIANPTDEALDLAGAVLRHGDHAWTLPAPTVAPAGGFLLLTCGGTGEGGDAPFTLSDDGGTLTFEDAVGGALDTADWPQLAEEHSWGRLPDVTGAWQTLRSPTPATPNRDDEPQPPELEALRLNEVFANGSESDDWLELVNPTDEPVALDGAKLALGGDSWTFPAGTTIPARGFYLLICDGSGQNGRTTFTLPASGGFLIFSTPDDATIDAVFLDAQEEDLSWGRLPDAVGDWQALRSPTPGAANRDDGPPPVDLTPLRLNELQVADGDGGCWIEIINPSELSLSLATATLSDGTTIWTLPPDAVASREDYLLLTCDGSGEGLDAPFTLSPEGGTLTLSQTHGDLPAELIDEVSYGPQLEGESWGRLPDATGDWQALRSPTPDEANRDDGPQQADLTPLRINEVFPNGSDAEDWVEIANPSDTPLDIGGATLSDGAIDWAFPDGLIVPSHGFLALPCDGSGATGSAPFTLSAAGGTLTLMSPEGELPSELIDRVDWSAVAVDRSWGRLPDSDGAWQLLNPPTPGFENENSGAPLQDLTPIRFNEIFADGSDTWTWVELANPTDGDLDLRGATLNYDDQSWMFAASGVVPAGGFLLVPCDGSDVEGHASFELSPDGGTITLALPNGELPTQTIDEATWGPQSAGRSWGRLPDVTGPWQILRSPTPWEPNRDDAGPPLPDATPLRLNEVFANGSVDADWIEIANPTDRPRDLVGTVLSDGAVDWTLPEGTVVDAEGFLVLICDGEGLNGTAPFRLSADGETLTMTSEDGVLLDETSFPGQGLDQSWVRMPDATGDWRASGTPTPGAPNEAAAIQPGVAELRLNELLADSPTEEDWIEIVNPTDYDVNLGGLLLSDSGTVWPLPQGLTAPAGGYLVLVCDGTGADGAAPFGLGRSGDTVTLSMPTGVVVDTVTYEALGPDVSWGRIPDVDGEWELLTTPTPGAPNERRERAVLINEMMANNVSTIFDPDLAEYGDWIEIINITDQPYDLSGHTLSDDMAEPAMWAFPEGTIIQRGGHLLVWADKKDIPAPTALHTNFKLSAGGETVGLFAPIADGGGLIDMLTSSSLAADESFGRTPDGADTVGVLPYPTPGAPNP